MRIQLTASMVSVGLMVSACGSSPAPAPTPTVTGITINSPNSNVFLGSVEQMAASARFSDGTSQTPTGTWGSDNTAVATVNSTGLVTTVSSGRATIFFDSSGVRGTKLIRVLPNYGGSFNGDYTVVSCSQTGVAATMNTCSQFAPGQKLLYTFTLTQTGETVNGKFTVGTVTGILQFDQTTAPIADNGELVLVSRTIFGPATIDVTWRLNSPAPGRLTGTHVQIWTTGPPSGSMTVNSTI